MEVGNGWLISAHDLLGMWLLIHARVNVKTFSQKEAWAPHMESSLLYIPGAKLTNDSLKPPLNSLNSIKIYESKRFNENGINLFEVTWNKTERHLVTKSKIQKIARTGIHNLYFDSS